MAISSSMLKGSLQTILLNMLHENGKMYGYEITQKVKDITKGDIKLTEGAIYPSLHKLVADGLLVTHTETYENRVRKYYALTAAGEAELANKLKEAESFIGNLQMLLNLKPNLS
ncbi:DNA-binding PadR family transcriptional regulator [Arcticibacter pallidicorallinus]|uniref:DNA-binding PadR family transcriptional regulator n=1 Tax=Arcticibacter pallidicorallinus TaxID=1259464 RepID=A0A2T0TXD2_9SPHI|nr:PadR family transcriptional regulator [Arcticibacter pallidicorallinus]PRY50300.1 DNA-binding PadR family transcriptional regulator [Arcticibacter pallidicorallinus]